MQVICLMPALSLPVLHNSLLEHVYLIVGSLYNFFHEMVIVIQTSPSHVQAYYGPRVTLPPYYNSTVASGHAPHPYMWGPPQVLTSINGVKLLYGLKWWFL